MSEQLPEMMKKKEINHLLVYLVAAVVCILSVIQPQKNILPQSVGIIVYILAAVSLVAACMCIERDYRKTALDDKKDFVWGTFP